MPLHSITSVSAISAAPELNVILTSLAIGLRNLPRTETRKQRILLSIIFKNKSKGKFTVVLVEELKEIIVSTESDLLCSGSDWNVSADNQRKNIIYPTKEPKYKYIEHTLLGDKEKVCVALGFNPAKSDVNEIDKTNQKIHKVLKKDYGSCILINLYPQVSSTKDEWDEGDNEDAKFTFVIKKLLAKLVTSEADVLIFWGRSVGVDKQIGTLLNQLKEQRRLFITVKKDTNKHYHPARVSIEIKEATQDSLIETTSIQ
jgi:hypothetical protein